jgi:hypothetical protein
MRDLRRHQINNTIIVCKLRVRLPYIRSFAEQFHCSDPACEDAGSQSRDLTSKINSLYVSSWVM